MCKELRYAVEEIRTELEHVSYILQTTEKSTCLQYFVVQLFVHAKEACLSKRFSAFIFGRPG